MINQTLTQIKKKISEIDRRFKNNVSNKKKYERELIEIKTQITELYRILDK